VGQDGNPESFAAPMNAVLKLLAEAAPDPECDDGIDNDGDGRIDLPADTKCLSLGGRERRACGLGFEPALLVPLLRRLRRTAEPG
jgi:hypothetical protein